MQIEISRFAGWALVAAIVAAAASALVVLGNESVDGADARVILTSLGFAAASTTGASGVAALLRPSWGMRALGAATIGCSLAAFGLYTFVVWRFNTSWPVPEWAWRGAACSAVVAIALAHASLLLRGRRPTDGVLVGIVTFVSLAAGAVDAGGALLPLAGVVDDFDESWERTLGAVLVVLIATTVLAPLLRRLRTPSVDAPVQPAMPAAA